MLFVNEPFPQSVKSHAQSQFAMLSDFYKQFLTAAQQFNELNIQLTQRLIQESFDTTRQLWSAQNFPEALSIAFSQVYPNAEKLISYQNQLRNIAATTQKDLSRTAEENVPEVVRTATAVADEVARTTSEATRQAAQRQKEVMDKVSGAVSGAAASASAGVAGVTAATAGKTGGDKSGRPPQMNH